MANKLPGQSYLREIFDFDNDSGALIWRFRKGAYAQTNARYAGMHAGHKYTARNGKSYIRVVIDYKNYMLHRIIWKYLYDTEPPQIDHIDGNGLNNRPENLRSSDAISNQRNKRLSSSNTSGCVGVSKRSGRNKWRAAIKVSGKTIELGSFIDYEEAVSARKAAEKKYGFHSEHGSSRPL